MTTGGFKRSSDPSEAREARMLEPISTTPKPLEGRRFVLTGATSGIGERTAYNLAVLGGEILVVGRSRSKVEAAAEGLDRAGGKGTPFVADLTEREAVRSLAAEITLRYPSLDVLINNAGALFYERRETAFGSERTFALNVEAPFLLTELLLPQLAKSGHGRVVHVASSAHRTGRMHFDDLDLQHGYSAWKAYGQSKLGLILMTRQEAVVHRDLPVTFNACHPGFVRSRFGDEGTGAAAGAFRVAKRLGGISVERGARAPTFLASSAEVESANGEYFIGTRPHAPSRRACRAEDGQRLWRELEARTGVPPPSETTRHALSGPVA